MKRHTLLLLLAFLVLAAAFAVAQQPTPAPQAAVKVFLAASGTAEHLPAVLDGISDCLSAKGVRTKQLSPEPKSRSIALDDLNQKGGAYLLFLSLDFAPGKNLRASLTMKCLDASAKLLWEEEAKGGMMMVTQSSYIKKMIKNACEKLNAHVGKEGLLKD